MPPCLGHSIGYVLLRETGLKPGAEVHVGTRDVSLQKAELVALPSYAKTAKSHAARRSTCQYVHSDKGNSLETTRMARIVSAGRLGKSPFYQSTIAESAEALLTYNNMLVSRGYGGREAEYWKLINGVSMRDVAIQRQVQLKGPEATKLAQILCARDLSKQVIRQGKYVPNCDHRGVLINDPVAMKVAVDHYWLSIGNSDIWFWARCIAEERGLNVEVGEPDCRPRLCKGHV